MSTTEMSELEEQKNKLALKRIVGKPNNIEINERTVTAYKEEYAKKGLVPTKQEDYPAEDFTHIARAKQFDSLVDPKQAIRKVITAMIRQPVTVFDKNGRPQVKDALYYYGEYYGTDKRGNDLGAHFTEGYYKKPKLAFGYTDPANPYDSKTGERRGSYRTAGFIFEHYIFLSENKAERVKFLNDLVEKATGTSISNLSQ